MFSKFMATLAGAALVTGLFVASASADKEAEKKFEATCPVSGGAAKKENAEKYKGKQVYFCCQNCPKAFKAEPKKFDTQVKLQWLETAQITQVGCPLSGKQLDESTAITVGKAKVAFCCENCKGEVEAASDKAKAVFANFDKAFTLQTGCPISGKPINAAQSVEHNGKKVYFCCPGCPDAFKKEPEKFMAKLPQFAKDDAEKK